jgi:hypothetical protein
METLDVVKSKIIEYLDRNLVLEPNLLTEIRENLPNLSADKVHSVYEILADLDQKQTISIKHKLEVEPYFFKKIEYLIYRVMYEEHVALEKISHEQADEELKIALKTL